MSGRSETTPCRACTLAGAITNLVHRHLRAACRAPRTQGSELRAALRRRAGQSCHEILHPLIDLVDDPPDGFEVLALRVVQVPAMSPPTAYATCPERPDRTTPKITTSRPNVATTSPSRRPLPLRWWELTSTAATPNMRFATMTQRQQPRTWPLGDQHGAAQGLSGPGLASRQREHDRGGHGRPGDPGGAVPGVVAAQQHDGRLDADVRGEDKERDPDQAQGSVLSGVAGVRVLPQHDRARADLHEAAEAEPGERDGPGRHGRHGQDGDPDGVPAERNPLQGHAPAQQPPAGVGPGLAASASGMPGRPFPRWGRAPNRRRRSGTAAP